MSLMSSPANVHRTLCRGSITWIGIRWANSWPAIYDFTAIEAKWQRRWNAAAANATLTATTSNDACKKEKYYVLPMFPYPSGHLHMGHVRVYAISDAMARLERARGKQVLHPMGWDSFGLPAENAAIERKISPSKWTFSNIEHMKKQLQSLGFHFDWSLELSTCKSDYYRWTQWLFLQLHKHGLAYRRESAVNWDPVDRTVLANEQVDSEGRSWRSGAKVEQRFLKQWFFRISNYADSLLDGIGQLDWPDVVKTLQERWIGKSQGVEMIFQINVESKRDIHENSLRVFTTRPETVFGVSFVAVAASHSLATSYASSSALARLSTDIKDQNPDGILLPGVTAVNPLTNVEVPVYAAQYVVDGHGTGAVMGVPAHDARDYKFAIKHELPIIRVLVDEDSGPTSDTLPFLKKDGITSSKTCPLPFSGLSATDAANAVIDTLTRTTTGGSVTHYRLRDWLVSRQRYWGAPIPFVHCEACGPEPVPVPEEDLPILLPNSDNITLTTIGNSPLATIDDWVNVRCPACGGEAHRDTDTMDTFVDSSWYFSRFPNSRNNVTAIDKDVTSATLPVDLYIGGVEHACMHLLYARFIHKFLVEAGHLNADICGVEPFKSLITQGMVQGKTYKRLSSGVYLRPDEVNELTDDDMKDIEIVWEKMSKSKYNGVDPASVITRYGADTVRLHVIFAAPPDASLEWNDDAISGSHRWLNRIWSLASDHVKCISNRSSQSVIGSDEIRLLRRSRNSAIKDVTASLTGRNTHNTAISHLMIFSNILRSADNENLRGSVAFERAFRDLLILTSPLAPHICAELWELLDKHGVESTASPVGSIFEQPWPEATAESDDNSDSDGVTFIMRIMGKKRGEFIVPKAFIDDSDAIERIARSSPYFATSVDGGPNVPAKRVIVVPRKMINFVL